MFQTLLEGESTNIHTHIHTDKQEDENSDGDHEGGVSVQRNGFHDPGFKDLVPSERVTRSRVKSVVSALETPK